MVQTNYFIVTGTPTENSWSQAYTYQFGETTILLLISLHKQGIFDLAMYGNKLADDLYQQLTLKLPLTIDQLKSLIVDFNPSTPQITLSLGLALIKNNYLQVVVDSHLSCFLFRQQQTIPLLHSPSRLTGLTGYLKPKDVFFLTTDSFANLIQPRLVNLIKDKHLQETLTRIVHAQTDSSQLTGLVYSLLPNPKFRLKLPHLKPSTLKLKRSPQPNQTNRFIAFSLIIFFFLSIAFGFFKRTQINHLNRLQQLQTTLNHNFDQITQLATTDPTTATNLFHQSQQLLDQYRQQYFRPQDSNQLAQLQTQLNQLQTQVFHYHQPKLETFLDLNSIFNQTLPTNLSFDPNNHLLAFSSPTQTVIFNLKDKSTLELSLNQSSLLDTALWNQALFILSPQAVTRLSLTTKQSKTVIQPDEVAWQHPKFLSLYAGNIYLLDPDQSEIWKYPITNDGYGQPRRWLAAGITPNLTKVIDFHIDGQVWFLTTSGKLQVYLHGVPTHFKLHGFVSNLTKPTSFFLTNQEIFVLEPNQNRILVFSKKDGAYLRQYLNSNFAQAKQIIVDDSWIYVWHDHFLSRFPL